VIRFSAFLVVVAVGLLVAGVVTSKLMLVYVAIGVSGVALLALAVGALVKRKELFGPSTPAEPQLARPEPAALHVSPGPPAPQAVPWGATVPAASARPAAAAHPAPSRAGYLPAEQPLPPQFQPQPQPQPQPLRPQPLAPQPVKAQPADVAATAWGSGIQTQTERPAAFTPRPPAGPPSPAPGVPAPGLSSWEWPPDAPATQEMPRIGAAPASSPAPPSPAPAPAGPPASATPPSPAPPREWPAPAAAFVPQVASPPPEPVVSAGPPAAEPASEDQPQDSPPAEETQQLPVAASIAADAPPASSEELEPAAEAAATPDTPDTPAAPEASDTPEAPDTVDLQREVTVVPGVPRYHHPHCLLIRFMGEGDLDKMTLSAARQAGCTPCRACLPDQADADPELDPPEPERQAEIALDVLPRRLGTRPRLDREHLDREHLRGDQPRVLGQGRDHIRVR
jgi:hypothetical protein